MPVHISQLRIRSAVRRMARQIDAACLRQGIQELTVVCVMDGAFVFTADLVRALRTSSRLVFLKAASYQGTRRKALRADRLPASLRVRTLLIVDTIYDTGKTIERVVGQARGLADAVWLAVLVEKAGKAAVAAEQQADTSFIGLRVAGDPFLIGYGLDVDGQYRSLPEIHEFPYVPARRIVSAARARKLG